MPDTYQKDAPATSEEAALIEEKQPGIKR